MSWVPLNSFRDLNISNQVIGRHPIGKYCGCLTSSRKHSRSCYSVTLSTRSGVHYHVSHLGAEDVPINWLEDQALMSFQALAGSIDVSLGLFQSKSHKHRYEELGGQGKEENSVFDLV